MFKINPHRDLHSDLEWVVTKKIKKENRMGGDNLYKHGFDILIYI